MITGIRILVVDEEDKLREIISRTLSADGHEVTQKTSGEEAMDAFRKNPFPLVIADIEMKRMSGIQLLQEVKQFHPASEVILTTNYPAVKTAIEALRHDACDYIMSASDSLDLISSAVNRAVEKIQQNVEYSRELDMLMKHNKELEQSWRTFKDSAARDEVTGLYNARFFHEALAVELNRSSHNHRNVSVVFLDVKWHHDNNPAQELEEKARLLCTVSPIVKKRLRQSDLLVRYRDETFAILLPETPRDGTRCVTESIRRLLSEHRLQGPSGNVMVSMRMAVYPEDGLDGTSLINNTTEC